MKKLLALFMVCLVLAATLSGCGKKSDSGENQGNGSNSGSTTSSQTASSSDSGVGFSTESEYYVFTVKNNYTLESDARLGVIPTGTIYTKEVDADEVDIIYCYADNWSEEKVKEYIFKFEKEYFESLEDGKYDMVLCSSDNEETGVVLLQIGMDLKNSKVTLDYENKK